MLMIISLIFMGLGALLSSRLRSKFEKYSQMQLTSRLSGAEVARKMLDAHGLQGVQITQVDGQLTDHYNPQNKTVNLSSDVYGGRHVSAAAVAAHECGHAVQHAEAYSMLTLRSAIVPYVNIAASAQQFLFMFGLAGIGMFNNSWLLIIALVAFGVTTFFSLVTLPVEFDASNRALAWLNSTNITVGAEHEGAKDALWWAAMTYVNAALAALVQFLYLLAQLLGRRD
jgi:uncharacterized protein